MAHSHGSSLFRCKWMYLSTHMYMRDATLGDIHFISQTHEEKANNELIMTHFFAPLILQLSLPILSSSECISWIDMQCSYFHFTPNKANTLFVWIRFKMSESAYICLNWNYTDSLGISFSLLFPSDQSYVSNSVQSTVCYHACSLFPFNSSPTLCIISHLPL